MIIKWRENYYNNLLFGHFLVIVTSWLSIILRKKSSDRSDDFHAGSMSLKCNPMYICDVAYQKNWLTVALSHDVPPHYSKKRPSSLRRPHSGSPYYDAPRRRNTTLAKKRLSHFSLLHFTRELHGERYHDRDFSENCRLPPPPPSPPGPRRYSKWSWSKKKHAPSRESRRERYHAIFPIARFSVRTFWRSHVDLSVLFRARLSAADASLLPLRRSFLY